MGFFRSLGSVLYNTATLPVSIVEDLATGGAVEERNATSRKLDHLSEAERKMAEAILRSLREG